MNFLSTRKVIGLTSYAFYFLLLLIATSCESDSLTPAIPSSQEGVEPTAVNQLGNLLIASEDGMFHFTDFDAFNAAINAVAPRTNKPFSEEELRAVESRLGVATMQGAYLDKVDEFDREPDLSTDWFTDNSSVITSFDGGISPVIRDFAVRTLINQEGRVKIGSDLFIFTKDHQMIIKNDPDDSAINKAIIKASTDIEQGIFVQTGWQSTEDISTDKTCNGAFTRGCVAAEINSHRVRGYWGYDFIFNSTVNEICPGSNGDIFDDDDDEFCFPVSVTFTVTHRYIANAKVEDRGLFNRWTRDQTALSFTCGVRAQGLPGSGMGWTSSSDVHEIDVSWSAGPSTITTVPVGTGGAPSDMARPLDYVTGGVDDENISGLFCFDCCPWDCANSDESDIP
ncbi:MAG: hypothetical protein AB8H12_15440 [Lewinella sp.]